MFYAIKSLTFSESCSNSKCISLKMSRIFLPSLKTLSSRIKISSNQHMKFELFSLSLPFIRIHNF